MTSGALHSIDAVALFPLPDVVFFPGTYLPLHVFEPRYRTMTERVLAGDRRLAVVLLEASNGAGDAELPLIHPVATVGEIVHHDRLEDGRFNIVLYGQSRARLTELPFVAPYRRARATLIEDRGNGVSDADIGALLSTATRFAGSVRGRHTGVDLELGTEQHAGKLADVCAHGLIIDARDRQKILETTDVRQRVRLVTETLAVQEALLGPSANYS